MEDKKVNYDVTVTALFGTLWGAVELSLGTFLHSLRIPFSGIVLAFISVMLIIILRSFINNRGSIIAASSVAAFLKLIILPGFNISPFIAIIFEGLIGEIVFLILSYNLFSSLLAGSLILLYTLIHSLIMQGVFFGFGIYHIYIDMINSAGKAINFKNQFSFILIPLIISIYILLGSLAGYLGWKAAKRTKEILLEDMV